MQEIRYRVLDAGYSGKNTKRPQFEKMMDDVESGNMNK